jgi:transcriptional regulator with XRE-family HTH domain
MAEHEERDPIAALCGKRIAQCREARGWSQKELSQRTGYRPLKDGLSPQRISNFEQGTRRVRLEEAETIAAVFTEFPAAYFMGAIDEKEARVVMAMRRPEPTRQRKQS